MSGVGVPAAAIEAAAKGIWQYYETNAASNSAEPTSEDTAIARAALEAAAPYLMAQAWEEGCRKGLGTNPGWEDEALARNPYRTSK